MRSGFCNLWLMISHYTLSYLTLVFDTKPWHMLAIQNPEPTVETHKSFDQPALLLLWSAAVFDGHSGPFAAEWLNTHLYEKFSNAINEDIISRSGSADNCEVQGEVSDPAPVQSFVNAQPWHNSTLNMKKSPISSHPGCSSADSSYFRRLSSHYWLLGIGSYRLEMKHSQSSMRQHSQSDFSQLVEQT